MTAQSTEAPPTAAAYVYGVVAADAVPELELVGVADAPVRVVRGRDVAALVSYLPHEQLRVRRRDLHGHLRVLEQAFAETTIVPCAFGMVLGSEEAVRAEFLDVRHDDLLALLRHLDGFGQLNVRVSHDEDVVLREIVAADPTIARLREETGGLGDEGYHARIRLGELVAAALASVREHDARGVLERLAPKAADVVVDGAGEDVVKASFLVAREGSIVFDREVEDIAREQAPRLRVEVVGPLPPTAFASLERGAWDS